MKNNLTFEECYNQYIEILNQLQTSKDQLESIAFKLLSLSNNLNHTQDGGESDRVQLLSDHSSETLGKVVKFIDDL
jgi:hypothetical protein